MSNHEGGYMFKNLPLEEFDGGLRIDPFMVNKIKIITNEETKGVLPILSSVSKILFCGIKDFIWFAPSLEDKRKIRLRGSISKTRKFLELKEFKKRIALTYKAVRIKEIAWNFKGLENLDNINLEDAKTIFLEVINKDESLTLKLE
jgi:hypothetical protein